VPMIFSFERLLKVALCAVGVGGAISLLAKLCRHVWGITVSDTERIALGVGVITLVILISRIRDFATAVTVAAVAIIGFFLLKLVVKFLGSWPV
jgi:hypothetical protein